MTSKRRTSTPTHLEALCQSILNCDISQCIYLLSICVFAEHLDKIMSAVNKMHTSQYFDKKNAAKIIESIIINFSELELHHFPSYSGALEYYIQHELTDILNPIISYCAKDNYSTSLIETIAKRINKTDYIVTLTRKKDASVKNFKTDLKEACCDGSYIQAKELCEQFNFSNHCSRLSPFIDSIIRSTSLDENGICKFIGLVIIYFRNFKCEAINIETINYIMKNNMTQVIDLLVLHYHSGILIYKLINHAIENNAVPIIQTLFKYIQYYTNKRFKNGYDNPIKFNNEDGDYDDYFYHRSFVVDEAILKGASDEIIDIFFRAGDKIIDEAEILSIYTPEELDKLSNYYNTKNLKHDILNNLDAHCEKFGLIYTYKTPGTLDSREYREFASDVSVNFGRTFS